MLKHDRNILRELATRYAEVAADPIQNTRRDLWRRHNALKQTRPLIYTRAFAWHEMPQCECLCETPLARKYEEYLRRHLFWHSLGDDSIFEPWITVLATHRCTGWGVAAPRHTSGEAGGSFKIDYPLRKLEDIDKLRMPWHEIDEQATAKEAQCLGDAIGDILTINIDRKPWYSFFRADLSTELGYLRGIEHFMLDMYDNPEWLHRLMGFMSQGVLRAQDQAEAAGDWGLSATMNQAMPYAESLPDPAANVNGAPRNQLWCFMAAQEFTAVSPALHEEFLLNYQLPIMKKFALVAYGCCEDLTHKIDMLRKIPNLRRIAVTPSSNPAKCAEVIGRDYVISYRPSPADMVGYGFDEDRIRRILRRDLTACRDCYVDITLKDVETVQRDPRRIRRWVQITREVIDKVFG